MSSAKVTIANSIIKESTGPGGTGYGGYQYANAAAMQHNDQAMVKLLKILVQGQRLIASQIQMGGVVTGVVAAGTGSATINVGFQPAFIRAFAYSGTVITSTAEFYSGMPSSSAVLTSTGGTPSSQSIITAGGYTPNATGFKGGSKVFPVGVTINYLAMRRVGP